MGTVSLKWIESHLMLGTDSGGHPVVIGNSPDHTPPWGGLKPSDLLMLAAASCASYDVVEILQKQREPLQGLDVTCDGTQLPDPPYTFTRLHLHYTIRGAVDVRKAERAIALAQDKYCSVITTLRPTVTVTSEVTIIA